MKLNTTGFEITIECFFVADNCFVRCLIYFLSMNIQNLVFNLLYFVAQV